MHLSVKMIDQLQKQDYLNVEKVAKGEKITKTRNWEMKSALGLCISTVQ